MRWIFVLVLVLHPIALRAEIYSYVDSNGVYTITNIPPPKGTPVLRTLDDTGGGYGGAATGPSGITAVTPPETYDTPIEDASRAQGIDPDLVRALIWVESAWNPRAVSNKGAKGLMQLIPETAQRFGVRDIFDPDDNINGGVKYLRFLMDMFEGNTSLTLAAYNAGENVVQRYNGVPPYRETQQYVKRIASIYGRDLQAAVRTPIFRVVDGQGGSTYTNTPPPKPASDLKIEKVLR